MEGFINDIDFINIEAEKYWTFPTSYKGNKQEEIEHVRHDGNYVGAEKKDGMYGRFINVQAKENVLELMNKSNARDVTYALANIYRECTIYTYASR